MAGTFLLVFPLVAAVVGAAYAIAWFCGRWVGLALEVGCLLGIVGLYWLAMLSFDRLAPVGAGGAGLYALLATGMVFVIVGASGPAIFGRHKAASVTSLVAGMLGVMGWPFIASTVALYFGLVQS